MQVRAGHVMRARNCEAHMETLLESGSPYGLSIHAHPNSNDRDGSEVMLPSQALGSWTLDLLCGNNISYKTAFPCHPDEPQA